MSKKIIPALVTLIGCFGVLAPSHATPVSYFGSGTAASVAVTASVSFDIDPVTGLLTVVLKNTSPDNSGQDVPGSTLTGVFFDLTGNPTLTPVSATIAAGSIVDGNLCTSSNCGPTQTNVGGEFGYEATSLPGGADRGIASSGYLTTGLPWNLGNFNGVNLDDPASLDGINFGIITNAPGFNPNGGLEDEPLIRDTVTFVLSGATGLTNRDVSHVSFQYGTALSEANVPGIPVRPDQPVSEPGTLLLVGAAALGLSLGVVRRHA